MFLLPSQLPVFEGTDDPALAAKLDELPILKFPRGFLLFAKGDPENDVLAILRGRVEIVGRSEAGELETVAVLQEGELFGEFSYFTGEPRSFSAVTKEESAILVLKAAWLKTASGQFPALRRRLESIYRSRVLVNVIRSCRLFSTLPPAAVEDLVSGMELRSLEPGAVILAEGETGLDFFVVKQGRVTVSKRKQGSPLVLRELGPGEMLGEMAIVTGRPRSASAHAAERTEVMVLKGEDFRALLARHPAMMRVLEDVVRNRSEQMRAALESVVSEVVDEEWDEETLTRGFRVGDLRVEVAVESEKGKWVGVLQEVSLRHWRVGGKGSDGPCRVGFVGGSQKFKQELAKAGVFPARISGGEEEETRLVFPHEEAAAPAMAAVVRTLAAAKLKGLIFPSYDAQASGIGVRVIRKGGGEGRGKLVSLSLTHARVELAEPVVMGDFVTLRLEREGKTLTESSAIPLGSEGGETEFQFEYGTSEERAALERMIREFLGGAGPTLARADRVRGAPTPRATVALVKAFKTAGEFVRTYMTSIEAGTLHVEAPKSLAEGTSVALTLLIPGFPGIRKANCSGRLRSWAKGQAVVELTEAREEIRDRLKGLFEKLIALQSEKSWQERRANLAMIGKSYSIWEDRTTRTAVLAALVILNLAFYAGIYIRLGTSYVPFPR